MNSYAVSPDLILRSIPERAANALSGSAFAQTIMHLSGPERDRAILAQIRSGNVPDFMRQLQPVQLGRPETGGPDIKIFVTLDYMAVGSNEDFIRVPLGLHAAAATAAGFDAILPTTLMVDAIAAQAKNRLQPKPMPPGPHMTSTDYFVKHNTTIDGQLVGPLGALTAGHKKDVVLTTRLVDPSTGVPIYGWHRENGRPIQPLYTKHGQSYADYSHGIRLVSNQVSVNGQMVSIYDVLADPTYSAYLSKEGVFPQAASIMANYSGMQPDVSGKPIVIPPIVSSPRILPADAKPAAVTRHALFDETVTGITGSGDKVRALQQALARVPEIGEEYRTIMAQGSIRYDDGLLGANTRAVVRNYAERFSVDLKGMGIEEVLAHVNQRLPAATVVARTSHTANHPVFGENVKGVSATGDKVRELQQALARIPGAGAEYRAVMANGIPRYDDGLLGDRTRAAVRSYAEHFNVDLNGMGVEEVLSHVNQKLAKIEVRSTVKLTSADVSIDETIHHGLTTAKAPADERTIASI